MSALEELSRHDPAKQEICSRETTQWAVDEIKRVRGQRDALRRAIRDCKDTLTEASLDLEDKVIAANLSWHGGQ